MPALKQYISKITLPNGRTYDIKDEEARDLIARAGLTFVISKDAATTPAGVEWDYGETHIVGTLVASETTKANIYLVPHKYTIGEISNSVDYHREYVTVNFGDSESPVWAWEYLGNTDIDISGLGALAYKSSATGQVSFTTADSATFSNGAVTASAKYTPTGSINVGLKQTSTEASLTRGNYTPEGTVSKPDITVTPTTATVEVKAAAGSVTAGSAASFTEGAFDPGSCTKAKDTFVAPTWTATVTTTEDPETHKQVSTETLVFSFNAGSFTEGALSYTAPSKNADTFVANTPTSVTLPTFKEQSVMTGASATLDAAPTFTGTTATNALVTGVAYDKATVESQEFTGTEATISSTGTATGDVSLTKTEKTETVTVS